MPSIARFMIAKRGIVHIMNAKDPTSGAQVVGRIASLLRALSGCMPEGAGTSELARQAYNMAEFKAEGPTGIVVTFGEPIESDA